MKKQNIEPRMRLDPNSMLSAFKLRYWSLLVFSMGLALSGCNQKPQQTEAEQQTLTQWLDAQYENELLASPIQLTFLGRKERNDEIDDFNYAAFAKQLQWKLESAKQMSEKFDYASLGDDEKLSYDLWNFQAKKMAESAEFFHAGLTFDQMNGIQNFIPTFLINFHRVDTPEDMQAYISRIKAVGPRMAQALENAQIASDKGVRSPLFALDGVIEQTKAVISGQPFETVATTDSDLWGDIKSEIAKLERQGMIDADAAEIFLADAKDGLIVQFQPAYNDIIAWAESEKDRAPAVSSGVGGQGDGDAYYKYRLDTQTTTELTAEEIHQIGLNEVKRLREEMTKIMRLVKFDGDLPAFFNHVRDAEWNYYPNTDDGRKAYIEDATLAIDNIKSKLPEIFGLLPKADLQVKRVEPFRERDGAAQHYYPGTPDGSRPGIYYAHLSDMTAMPKNQLEVIAYHEGLPGHHMQISIAQELENIPVFRTQANFTVYSEGWGLYSEWLAKEIPGTYTDPYQDFGRLTAESWRAIRLVVDTGLHAKGWTEQQAIDYFSANSPEPLESVISEIQRYIVMPGQATAYKIGMLKIQALRTKATQVLGDKFNLGEFHDAILNGGALPLFLLERKIDSWIKSEVVK
jgi:uncharacterized protein (DUF885 family)